MASSEMYNIHKISNDGKHIYIVSVIFNTGLQISHDYGETFNEGYQLNAPIDKIEISLDGKHIITYNLDNSFYISHDYGETFNELSNEQIMTLQRVNVYNMNMSYNGQYVLISSELNILFSNDYGEKFDILYGYNSVSKFELDVIDYYFGNMSYDGKNIYITKNNYNNVTNFSTVSLLTSDDYGKTFTEKALPKFTNVVDKWIMYEFYSDSPTIYSPFGESNGGEAK